MARRKSQGSAGAPAAPAGGDAVAKRGGAQQKKKTTTTPKKPANAPKVRFQRISSSSSVINLPCRNS